MDVEAVAVGLSRTHKHSILKAFEQPEGLAVRAADSDCEELEMLGITGQDGWSDILTPLGLAVREYLEKQNGSD